ncbi:hypothetical protein [Priestia koreensis]|uniref:hypothetical protein n=1 Tax=Priestia koreensis TaxID=284581 RepID=UPI001F59FC66|nr:hypothetical protein [Priestia koreensis]UNL83077.1 hypothetical protein IE339_12815 [Priestia koreensis]
MKILLITVSMFVCLVGFATMLNMFEGFTLYESLRSTLSPFRVMELAEIVVLIVFILLFVAESAYVLIKKRKNMN